MSALLELRGADKSFRGLRAVANVSFELEENAVVALIGANGAGKTTLFNLIAGALPMDSGEIHFDGRRIDRLSADRACVAGIGRTFQIVKPFSGLSVLDNVIVGALLRCAGVGKAQRYAESILDRLGLGAKRHLPASALTLPDRKRLEVARALATRPKLLLLDEVLAGLRPAECDEMAVLLREINRAEGVAILMIEHVMRAVMALAHQVIVMGHGQIIFQGTPDDAVRHPAVIESYLGEYTPP